MVFISLSLLPDRPLSSSASPLSTNSTFQLGNLNHNFLEPLFIKKTWEKIVEDIRKDFPSLCIESVYIHYFTSPSKENKKQ